MGSLLAFVDKKSQIWYNKEQQAVLGKKAFQPFG